MYVLPYLPLLIGTLVALMLLKVFHQQSLPVVTFTVNVDGIIYILKGKSHMTNATVDNTVTVSAAFADRHGNPAAPATQPIWSVDTPSVATLAASVDGLSVQVTPVGPAGTAVITVTDGHITASTSIQFAGGAAATVTLSEVVNPAA